MSHVKTMTAHIPKILLLGPKRSGKSSICRVVFHHLSPNDTLFLETTPTIVKESIEASHIIHLTIWDVPGQFDALDIPWESIVPWMIAQDSVQDSTNNAEQEKKVSFIGRPFKKKVTSQDIPLTVVFVIDAQDDYLEALSRLYLTITRLAPLHQPLFFDVFIHKVEVLTEQVQFEIQREIQLRMSHELEDTGLGDVPINYHLTSIYDHSVFEALSKVIQKMMVELPVLENLLDMVCNNSGIEKAFLFDPRAKIYLATDSSPLDGSSFELCSDVIDVVLDLISIYQTGPSVDTSVPQCSSMIRLSHGMALFYRQVHPHVVLVCLKAVDKQVNRPLLEHNFALVEKAISSIFKK